MASYTAIFTGNCLKTYIKNSREYFRGCYPSIAANSAGNLVCAYSKSSNICYAVGEMTEDISLQWNSQRIVSAGNHPKVAINENNKVVLVFINGDRMNYRVGDMPEACNSISWNNAYDIGIGENPSVAISGNTVFLVYQIGRECRWCVGQLDTTTYCITWKRNLQQPLVSQGNCPSICVKDNLLAVFCRKSDRMPVSFSTSHKLFTMVGVMQNGGNVEWGHHQEMLNYRGDNPCISMFKNGVVITVLQEKKGPPFFAAWKCGSRQ